MPGRAVVTGAFSYTGSAVARELMRRGWQIHTLTNRRSPPGADHITSSRLLFDAAHLARELEGADLFVNTYWVRLPHGRRYRQKLGIGSQAARSPLPSDRRPSTKTAPSRTRATRCGAFTLRQRSSATRMSLYTIVSPASRDPGPFVTR